MIVHLVDGTYELFRHFYGLRRANNGDPPFGAVRGVLHLVLQMIETGSTHIGVATDHVIESFRNELWPGYKTGFGIEPALASQFHPLEEALAAMGVAVWPMVDLEADDALASAAALASADPAVEKVCIWTPDKDLTQCVVGDRVVQVDRKSGTIRDANGVRAKFGVSPESIPDYLALVGDAADGFPGLPGFGAKSAAAVLSRFGHLESIPADSTLWRCNVTGAARLAAVLREQRELAFLFRTLATLRCDAELFESVEALRWTGPTEYFAGYATRIGAPELIERADRVAASVAIL
jgi:5'-3' exonuclease